MCHSPQVLKSDKLSSLCRGHVRRRALAQDAGPCAALAVRAEATPPGGRRLILLSLRHDFALLSTTKPQCAITSEQLDHHFASHHKCVQGHWGHDKKNNNKKKKECFALQTTLHLASLFSGGGGHPHPKHAEI